MEGENASIKVVAIVIFRKYGLFLESTGKEDQVLDTATPQNLLITPKCVALSLTDVFQSIILIFSLSQCLPTALTQDAASSFNMLAKTISSKSTISIKMTCKRVLSKKRARYGRHPTK